MVRMEDAPSAPTGVQGQIPEWEGLVAVLRAWAVPPVHPDPVWMDKRSPQYAWTGQGGMWASPNTAKAPGLEGCCQESPAATSHIQAGSCS